MIWLWFLGAVISLYLSIKLFIKYQKFSHDRYWRKLGVPADLVLDINLLDVILQRKTFADTEPRMNQKLKDKNYDFAGFTELGTRILIVRDPELIKRFLVKDADIWINRRFFEMSKSDLIISKMLFFMMGQEWKDMRSLLSPNFTTGKIKIMFQRISDCADMLVEHLDKGGDLDVRDTMSSYTMDVIASAFFGIEVGTIKNREAKFAKMGKKMQTQSPLMIAKIIVSFMFPKLASKFRVRFFEVESTDFFHRVVKETIVHREKNNVRRNDFLQLLIDYKNNPDEGKKIDINDDVIGSQAVLFLLGGFDTVETLLTFSAYHLALDFEVQEKILSEVKSVMAQYEGKITYEGVNQMEYMDRFINETLRLYPPVPRLDRTSIADYQIPNTKIVLPKGSLVAFPAFALHRDPDYFENPEKFDPDRWLEKDKINPYAYLPFGQGPRNCIGMRFALIEAKTILSHLVLNFKMEPTDKTPIPIKLTMNMKPKELVIKFTKRN